MDDVSRCGHYVTIWATDELGFGSRERAEHFIFLSTTSIQANFMGTKLVGVKLTPQLKLLKD